MSGLVGSLISSTRGNVQTYTELTSGTSQADVIYVCDLNGNQLFPDARPITCKVNPQAEFPKHPLETGATFGDHRIIKPIEIEMNMVFLPDTYSATYQAVRSAFYSNNSMRVFTRVGYFKNMFIMEMPHDETSEVYDTITMILKLQEVPMVSSQTTSIKKVATNSATNKRGSQQGKTVAAPTQSTPTSGSLTYDTIKHFMPSF